MKLLITFVLTSVTAFAAYGIPSVKECRVSKTTSVRMSNEIIQEGSLAVTVFGEVVTIDGILKDEMIHFQNVDGKISESYQWMYNSIFQVQNREDKYLASSYGEDVIITLGHHLDPEGTISVTYVGTETGNYLSLSCTL